MGLFQRASKKNEISDIVAKLISESSVSPTKYSEEEDAFWATFVNDFVKSEEWFTTVKRLIEYWKEIDTVAYPMYSPLQDLSDWELAYGVELWVVYDFISTYVEYGEIEEINPSIQAGTRRFLAEYFAAVARKMDQGDIEGFVSVVKSQIEEFGIEDLMKNGIGPRFK